MLLKALPKEQVKVGLQVWDDKKTRRGKVIGITPELNFHVIWHDMSESMAYADVLYLELTEPQTVEQIWKVEVRGRPSKTLMTFDVELWLVFAKDEAEIRTKLNITDPSVRIHATLVTPDKPELLGLIEFDGTITPTSHSQTKELTGQEKYWRDEASRCHLCGGKMTWCESCQQWSSTCCEDFGTCQCS